MWREGRDGRNLAPLLAQWIFPLVKEWAVLLKTKHLGTDTGTGMSRHSLAVREEEEGVGREASLQERHTIIPILPGREA